MEFYSNGLRKYLVSNRPGDIPVKGRKLRTLLGALEGSGLLVERVGNRTNVRDPQALLAWLTLDERGEGFAVTFSLHIRSREVTFQPELLLPSQFLTRRQSGWSYYAAPILNALGITEVVCDLPEEVEVKSLSEFGSFPHNDAPTFYFYKSEEWGVIAHQKSL